MNHSSIACKNLSVGFMESSTSTVVRQNIDLHASEGELIAIIGSNGIGKSTLLRTIAGFQKIISGDILVNQQAIATLSAAELSKEISFVSTTEIRVTDMTVRDLVGLGRFPHTNWFGQLTEEDHAVVREAIHTVGLAGFENRLLTKISDGERQRAMIARALAQDTPIILLDEPTAFLDISNKYEIVRILHNLAREKGKCILFSTHDLPIALSTADGIWLLLKELSVEGTPEELAEKKYFDQLFPNNDYLCFDSQKGDFRLRK